MVLLYPEGQVSPVQERQLASPRPGVVTVRVRGSFDDCQRLVKEAFLDRELTEACRLTSANSINVARLIPQAFLQNSVRKSRKACGQLRMDSVLTAERSLLLPEKHTWSMVFQSEIASGAMTAAAGMRPSAWSHII